MVTDPGPLPTPTAPVPVHSFPMSVATITDNLVIGGLLQDERRLPISPEKVVTVDAAVVDPAGTSLNRTGRHRFDPTVATPPIRPGSYTSVVMAVA